MINFDFNIINLGFNPWSPYWKRNQTIVYWLSKNERCKEVLFLHSEVWLTDLVLRPKSSLSGLNLFRWQTIWPRKVWKKIKAFTPIHFPKQDTIDFIGSVADVYNFRQIKKYFVRPFLLIINDPQANQSVVDKLCDNSFMTIFDWSDDFVEFSSNDTERLVCANTCKKYCKKSDIVLTVNDTLLLRAKQYNKNSFTIKNATNFFSFDESSHQKEINVQFRPLNGKIVGYMGWLNSLRLDIDLLYFVIMNRPDVQFVFIGPVSEPAPLGYEIPLLPNVHLFPPVPYIDYLAHLRALDVCILPNKITPHTEGNDPIKIYDYLASGNPIVSTRTAGTEQFKDYIYWANDKYEFLDFLNEALAEDNLQAKKARLSIALQHSWQSRYAEIEKILKPFWPQVIIDRK